MQKRAFISTQGPLARTFDDFWQMVWQESVVVIVMTTRTVERGRQKCGQYWPLEADSSMDFENFKVTNEEVMTFSDYMMSNLTVVYLKVRIILFFTMIESTYFYVIFLLLLLLQDNSTRRICHMLFLSWPDYGVPHSAVAMLEFREKVRIQQKTLTETLTEWDKHPNGPPIIVHCSAGIGRTGTFMTLDISKYKV